MLPTSRTTRRLILVSVCLTVVMHLFYNTPQFKMRNLNLQLLNVCMSGMEELSTKRDAAAERILVNVRHNLGYCNVPKVGSSFWFAVFSILDGNINSSKSPDDVLNNIVENVQFSVKVKVYSQMSINVKNDLSDSGTMFLFVRNPYFRILSAYVNKLLSPNSYYWKNVGSKIVKGIRSNASANSIKCGHDVTFTEFLTFISRQTDDLDHHWAPIYQLCSPCHYPYKYIGRAETLEEDTARIIKNTNISSFIDYDPNRDNQVHKYMMAKINQFVHHYKLIKECISVADMMLRLWECFKAKGYLPLDSTPPDMSMESFGENVEMSKTQMLNKSFALYKGHVTSGGMSAYSDKFAAQMYKSVPTKLLYKIQKIFLPDFLLFGYDPEPMLLFTDNV